MSDPVERLMSRARVWLLLKQPFFGQIITQLDLQDASDYGWCPTAATDGFKLYYNREFIKGLTEKQLIFLFAHEVMHVVLQHVFRRGERDRMLWNHAVDFIVNWILTRDQIGEMPPGGLLHKAYTDDFSAGELYDLLLDKNYSADGGQQPLDVHLDGKGGTEQDGQQEPQFSDEQIAEMQDNMRNVVIQAAKTAGNLPLGVKRLIDQLNKPKIDWRRFLHASLRSTIKHDYTYTRLSRRSWTSNMILPGQEVTEKVKAVVWMDASRSTTQEMVTDFLSECKGIMTSFRDFELTIGTFDTAVYNVETFTPRNIQKIEDYRKKFAGGGGTLPSCCWDYMKANKLSPHRVVLLGDGYFGNDWGDPKFCDTLFVIHSNPTAQAPYGRLIHYQ